MIPEDDRAGRFASYSNADLAGQCRMQARESLEPDYEAFMYAVASHLTRQEDETRRAAPDLVSDVARAIDDAAGTHSADTSCWAEHAHAAIAVVRKAALEEALHIAEKEMAVLHVCRNYELASEDEYQSLRKVIAAIRDLKEAGHG